MEEFNRRFAWRRRQKGSALCEHGARIWTEMFSLQHERTVNQDNTVQLDNRVFQIEKTRWRNTLAGCTVIVHEHLDGRSSDPLWPASRWPNMSRTVPPGRSPRDAAPRPPYRQGGMKGNWLSGLEALPPDLRDLPRFCHPMKVAQAGAVHCVRLRLMVWPR